MIDNSLGAAGTNAAAVGLDKLGQVGVLYTALRCSVAARFLVSLILAEITACMIDRALKKAAAFALAGAFSVLRFHAQRGHRLGQDALVAISYLGVALLLAACAKVRDCFSPGKRGASRKLNAMPERRLECDFGVIHVFFENSIGNS